MPQVVIVSSLGPQGQVGPQGPSGSFDNISGSFLYTSSFNEFTASVNTFTASYNTGSFTGSFTGSATLGSLSASSAFVTGNVTVLGTASINTLIVNQTQLSTGSNQLGDAADDTQTLYGTVRIPTGSLTVTGSTTLVGNLVITASTSPAIRVIGNYPIVADDGPNGGFTVNSYNTALRQNFLMLYSNNGSGLSSTATGDLTIGKFTNAVLTSSIFVSGSGNMGIGTTSPTTKLHVSGTIKIESTAAVKHLEFTRVGNNYISTANGGTLLINVVGTAAENTSLFRVYPSAVMVGNGLPLTTATFNVRGSGTTSGTTSLLVQNANASASLVVLDDGDVGIGTTTPTQALDVSGSIALNGNIIQNQANLDIKLSGLLDGRALRFITSGNGARIQAIGSSTSNLTLGTTVGGSEVARMTILEGGNVGIGTTTPTASLHIVDAGVSSTNSLQINQYFKFRGDGVMNWGIGMTQGILSWDNGKVIIGASSGNSLELYSGGSVKMFISGSGNVGIGTTAPTSRLQVRGPGTTSSTTSLLVENANASASMVVLDDGNVGIGRIPSSYTVDISGSFRVQTNTLGLLVNTNGSTQIDTTAGNNGLYINDTVYSILKLGDYRFVQGRSAKTLSIRDSADIDVMFFASGSKNVGIGTTTPQRRLHVDTSGSGVTETQLALTSTDVNNRVGILFASSSLASGRQHKLLHRVNNPTVEWLLATNAGESGIWRFSPRDDNNYAVNIIAPYNGGTAYLSTGLSQSLFSLGAGGQLLQHLNISSSGNVGIGTTTPDSYYAKKLVISSPDEEGITLASTSTSATNYIAFADGITGNQAYRGTIFYRHLTDSFGFSTSGTTRMTIDGSGNTGIGTTTPTSRLQVRSSGTTSATTALLVENANASSSLAVLDNGNVGIGTSAPTERLEVNGSILIEGSSDYRLKLGAPIGQQFSLGTVWNGSYDTMFIDYSALGSPRIMTFQGNGNVGIGTSTPSEKLQVIGNIRVQSSLTDIAAKDFSLVQGHYTNAQASLNIISTVSNAAQNIIWIGGGNASYNAATDIRFFTTGSNSTLTGTERMRINGDGNVGIGTSTPTSTLDIQSTATGSIRISGSAGSQITLVRPTAGLFGYVRYIGGEMEVGTNSGDGLRLNTSNTTRLAIQTNGDVGIGLAVAPSARLQIKGSGTTSATSTFRLENSSALPSLVVTDDLNSRFFGNVGIGTAATSGSFHISASASTSSAAVFIYKSGSTTLDIQGSQGQLFSVTDQLSGSLMSVNDISGLPILEVFSDDRVVMGSFASPALIVTGSAVRFPATGSAAPTYSGSNGETIFTVIGGNAFIYVWLGGRWRSGSLT